MTKSAVVHWPSRSSAFHVYTCLLLAFFIFFSSNQAGGFVSFGQAQDVTLKTITKQKNWSALGKLFVFDSGQVGVGPIFANVTPVEEFDIDGSARIRGSIVFDDSNGNPTLQLPENNYKSLSIGEVNRGYITLNTHNQRIESQQSVAFTGEEESERKIFVPEERFESLQIKTFYGTELLSLHTLESLEETQIHTALTVNKDVTIDGPVRLKDFTDATSLSRAALEVNGGVSVKKSAIFGENVEIQGKFLFSGVVDSDLAIASTTPATSISKGSLHTTGGLAVERNAMIGGPVYVADEKTASSSSDASITTRGGLGVARDAVIDGDMDLGGAMTTGGRVEILDMTDLSLETSGGIFTRGPINSEEALTVTAPKGLVVEKDTVIGGTAGVTGDTDIGGVLSVFYGMDVIKGATIDGPVALTDFTDVTSLEDAALKVNGGVSVKKSAIFGENVEIKGKFLFSGVVDSDLAIASTTPATSISKGSLHTTGGLAVGRNAMIGGPVHVVDNTTASSSSNASITTEGGLGVARDTFIDGNTNMKGTLTVKDEIHSERGMFVTDPTDATYDSGTNTLSGSIVTSGGIAADMDIYTNQQFVSYGLDIISDERANDFKSGSIHTLGGIGVEGNAYFGDRVRIEDDSNVDFDIGANTLSGSLVTEGGLGVSKDVYILKTLNINDRTNAGYYYDYELQREVMAGSIVTTGGIAADKDIMTNAHFISTKGMQITNDLESGGHSSGSITTSGGLGVGKNVHIGQTLDVLSTMNAGIDEQHDDHNETTVSGSIHTAGGVAAEMDILAKGNVIAIAGMQVAAETQSTNSTSGSFTTVGGAGVGKSLFVGGKIDVENAENAYLVGGTTSGSIHTNGGLGVDRDIRNHGYIYTQSGLFSPDVSVTAQTQSTSWGSGALRVQGGVGVRQDIFVGGDIDVEGTTQGALSGSSTTVGSIHTNGGIGADQDIVSRGYMRPNSGLQVNSNTQSYSSSTGSIRTNGGAGVQKNLFVGENIDVGSSSSAYNHGYTTSGSIHTNGGIGIDGNSVTLGNSYVGESIDIGGQVSNSQSTSTTSGTLRVVGGAGITRNVNIGERLDVLSTQAASQMPWGGGTDGAIHTYGGLGVDKGIVALQDVEIKYGTLSVGADVQTYSSNTGSITTSGGVGVGRDIYVSSDVDTNTIHVRSTTQASYNQYYGTMSGSIKTNGGMIATGEIISRQMIRSYASSGTSFYAYSTQQSTSCSSGSIVTQGGMGVAKNLYVGQNLDIYSYTDSGFSGSTTYGSIHTNGGIGADKDIITRANMKSLNVIYAQGTAQAYSTSSGALQVTGGAGIQKNLYVGEQIDVSSTTQGEVNGAYTTGSIHTNGGIGANRDIVTAGTMKAAAGLEVASETQSTDVGTGAVRVVGGASVGMNLYVGERIDVSSTTQADFDGPHTNGSIRTDGGIGADKDIVALGTMKTASGVDVASDEQSTSPTTGSIRTNGGAGVERSLYVGEQIDVSSTEQGDFTDESTTGSIHTDGGIGADLDIVSRGTMKARSGLEVAARTQSRSKTTGSIITLGGAGIGKNLHVGGKIHVDSWEDASHDGDMDTLGGSIVTNGGLAADKDILSNQMFISYGLVINGASESETSIVAKGGMEIGGLSKLSLPLVVSDETNGFYDPDTQEVSGSIQTAGGIAAERDVFAKSMVNAGEGMQIFSNAQSMNSATGSFTTAGGAGVARNLHVGENIFVDESIDVDGLIDVDSEQNAEYDPALHRTIGSIHTAGGIGVDQDIVAKGTLYTMYGLEVQNMRDSHDPYSGSIITSGGVGVGRDVNVGGDVSIENDLLAQGVITAADGLVVNHTSEFNYEVRVSNDTEATYDNHTDTVTGSIMTKGGIAAGKTVFVKGMVKAGEGIEIFSNAQSMNPGTGSFTTAGGAGVARNLHVGENIDVDSEQNGAYIPSLDETVGSIHTAGGIGVDQDIVARGGLHTMYGLEVHNMKDSHDPYSGSIITSGGVGVGRDVNVGGNVSIENDLLARGLITAADGLVVNRTSEFHDEVRVLDDTDTTYDHHTDTVTGSIMTRGGIAAGKTVFAKGMVKAEGGIEIVSKAQSMNPGTGSFTTAGGAGVARNLHVGENIDVDSEQNGAYIPSLDETVGSIHTAGGIGVDQDIVARGGLHTMYGLEVHNMKDSHDPYSGSIITSGGVGVGRDVNVGGNVSIENDLLARGLITAGDGLVVKYFSEFFYGVRVLDDTDTTYDHHTDTVTGSIMTRGGIAAGKTVFAKGMVKAEGGIEIVSKAQSMNPGTGSFTTAGGAGVGGNLHVGENIDVDSEQNGAYIPSLDETVGSIHTAGGIGVDQDIVARGGLYTMYGLEVQNMKDSHNPYSGSIVTKGGVGVGRDVNVGGDVSIENDLLARGLITAADGLVVNYTSQFFYGVQVFDDTEATYDSHTDTVTGSIMTRGGIAAGKTVFAKGMVKAEGGMQIFSKAQSMNPGTGSFTTAGGAGVGGNLHVGENIDVDSEQNGAYIPSLDETVGSIHTAGGIGVDQDIVARGGLHTMYGLEVHNVKDSYDPYSGSIVTKGGAGVGKSLHVGENIMVDSKENGEYISSEDETVGSIHTVGGIGVEKDIVAKGTLHTMHGLEVHSMKDSDGTSSGSIMTYGGVGVGKSVNVGGNVSIESDLFAYSDLVAQGSITAVDGLVVNYTSQFFYGVRVFDETQATYDHDTDVATGSIMTRGGIAAGKDIITHHKLEGGSLTISSTVDSTSTTTGSILTSGGAGITQSVNIGKSLQVHDTEEASYVPAHHDDGVDVPEQNSGAIITNGGILSDKDMFTKQKLKAVTGIEVQSTQDASISNDEGGSVISGSIITEGGVAMRKSLFVGSNVDVEGTTQGSINPGDSMTSPSTSGSIHTHGGIGADLDIVTLATFRTSSGVAITSETASTSKTSGSIVTAGGAGIGGSVFVGSNVDVEGTTQGSINPGDSMTSPYTTGSIHTHGGIGADLDIVSIGAMRPMNGLYTTSETDSTSTTSGSITTSGGVGIGKSLFVGASIDVESTTDGSLVGQVTTGSIHTAGGMGVDKDIVSKGAMKPVDGLHTFTVKLEDDTTVDRNPRIESDAHAEIHIPNGKHFAVTYADPSSETEYVEQEMKFFNGDLTVAYQELEIDDSWTDSKCFEVANGGVIQAQVTISGKYHLTSLSDGTPDAANAALTIIHYGGEFPETNVGDGNTGVSNLFSISNQFEAQIVTGDDTDSGAKKFHVQFKHNDNSYPGDEFRVRYQIYGSSNDYTTCTG